jgi:hypothetical protein
VNASINNGIQNSGDGSVTVSGAVFGRNNVTGPVSGSGDAGDRLAAGVETLRALIRTHGEQLEDAARLERDLERLIPAVSVPDPDPEYVRTLLGRLQDGFRRVAAAVEPVAAVTGAVAAVVPLVGS